MERRVRAGMVRLEAAALKMAAERFEEFARTAGFIHFITLVSGCPGGQLSKGFEINEDTSILRYATVHTLIYACFLMCI